MTQQSFISKESEVLVLTQEQKERLYKEVKDGATFGRFSALIDSYVYGVAERATKRTDMETKLLRTIARLANAYRRDKLHNDRTELFILSKEWFKAYGKDSKKV